MMIRNSRKKIVLTFVILLSLMWIPVALLSLLAWMQILPSYLPIALIVFYSLISILSGIHYPAWFSWMGDLVPEKTRGRYFSKRNLILGFIGLIASLLGSVLLKSFKAGGLIFLGFALLFVTSAIFRLISYTYLKKQYEPKLKINNKDYFSFLSFIKRYDNFGKFAIYQAVFNFAIMIASPFFTVYMLQNLGFEKNYLVFGIVSLSSTVFYLAFSPLAGKFSDRYGNLKLMYIANALFVLTPIAWIFIKNPLWLIAVPQLISGMANAAFIIAFSNFTYDSVRPTKRGICMAYTNILIGIGGFVGALIGGLIISYASLSINTFFMVFIIASLTRLITGILFLPQIKEVKKVSKIPAMHISLIHPVKTIQHEIDWIKKIVK